MAPPGRGRFLWNRGSTPGRSNSLSRGRSSCRSAWDLVRDQSEPIASAHLRRRRRQLWRGDGVCKCESAWWTLFRDVAPAIGQSEVDGHGIRLVWVVTFHTDGHLLRGCRQREGCTTDPDGGIGVGARHCYRRGGNGWAVAEGGC